MFENQSGSEQTTDNCPLTELLDIIIRINGEQMPGWALLMRGTNLNPGILRMLEDTFSLGAAHSAYKFDTRVKLVQAYQWLF